MHPHLRKASPGGEATYVDEATYGKAFAEAMQKAIDSKRLPEDNM